MNNQTLFIETLRDLESRLNSREEYEILMISGLLRKLLLDDNPLVNQINKEYRLKIKFIINDKFSSDATFWSIEDGIDPNTAPFPNVKEVNVEGFLQKQIMVIGGREITIKDLIKHMTNVEGGVHPGVTKTEKDRILKEIGQNFVIGGLPAGIRLLRAVSRVVLKGLEPLRQKVS